MPALLALLLTWLSVTAGPAAAQAPTSRTPEPSSGGTFITPFPDGEAHRVQVYGEGMAEGLLGGLVEAIGREPRILLQRRHRTLANVLKGEIADEVKAIESELERETPHIAVIMPSMIFRFPWREQFDRRFPPGSEARREEIERRRQAWKSERGQRIDLLMRAFRKKNVAVYWVGLPIMRNMFTNDDAQVINDLLRERAAVSGAKFIDIYASFADEGGGFSFQGPDIEGKQKNLRDQEGVWFTGAGYRKLAHFVERELKRDLVQARTERAIPLAGSEEEQRRVRPATMVLPQKASASPGAAGGREARSVGADRTPGRSNPGLRPPGSPEPPSTGDIQADNSRITLKSVNLQGRDESLTIEIVRPSIPATVYAAVTRRESADKASQLGDPVLTELQGGQMVISTVTPFADGAGGERRRGVAANSPFQLVLEKGQRLAPKPGRADELPWPRVESLPPQAPTVVRPAAGGLRQAPQRARGPVPRG